jgi:hypothetical protein
MESSGEKNPLWRFCRLNAARCPEDLDDALERLLDAWDDVPSDPGAPARLAAVFGLSAEDMERRTGVAGCPTVAAARLALIGAAFTECRLRVRNGGRNLGQALAVCAALQFEALGEVSSGAAAFAAMEKGAKAVPLARILRSALYLGPCVGLAVMRGVALAGNGDVGACGAGFSDGWAEAAE